MGKHPDFMWNASVNLGWNILEHVAKSLSGQKEASLVSSFGQGRAAEVRATNAMSRPSRIMSCFVVMSFIITSRAGISKKRAFTRGKCLVPSSWSGYFAFFPQALFAVHAVEASPGACGSSAAGVSEYRAGPPRHAGRRANSDERENAVFGNALRVRRGAKRLGTAGSWKKVDSSVAVGGLSDLFSSFLQMS